MPIQINQTVKIMFEVRIDGVLVDGSRSNKPFEFSFGTGQVIAGLEKRIVNMKVGEAADILVPASEAYGEYEASGIQNLPKEQFEEIENLAIGMQIQAQDENDQPIQFFGDGTTRRDYTFVADTVNGILNAIEYEGSNYEVFNLGNHQTVSLAEMIATLEEVFNKKAIIQVMPEQMGDVPVTYADISKAKSMLNYTPETNFKDGVILFKKWLLAQ